MLTEIKDKVEKRLDNSEKEVILGVYRNLVNSHNEFCDCNYCNILKEYVIKKKRLNYSKRMINYTNYEFLEDGLLEKNLKFVEILKNEVKKLKQEKDKLKEYI